MNHLKLPVYYLKNKPMKTNLILLFTALSVSTYAQTKIIAFKSHSGNSAEFNLALANNLFDMDEDNLGMAPERRFIKEKNLHPKLDSVVFVSADQVKLFTSSTCKIESDYSGETHEEKWKPGVEIAYNHPLFSKNHSLDSIKKVLKDSYGFENPIDKVVFVGYDNENMLKAAKKEKINKENKLIETIKNEPKRKGVDKSILIVLGLTLSTFIAGLFAINKSTW